jgi:hypothetical protein
MAEHTRIALGLVFIVGSVLGAYWLLWLGDDASARPTLEVDRDEGDDEFWSPRSYGDEGE